MEVIIVKDAKEYVEANFPNDPLLKRIVINLLDQLPKMEIEDGASEDSGTVQQDNKLEKAVRLLRKNYDKAKSAGYVRNKLAWALYQTWNEVSGNG